MLEYENMDQGPDLNKRDIEFLYEVGCLRFIPRAWRQFLLPNFANLAEHTLRVMWTAATIAKYEKADTGKVIKMALVHDIGETIVGDVGTFVKGMAGGVFKNIEEEGVKALVEGLDSKDEIINLVSEYNERGSLEARVVKAADNLDALAQAKGVPGAKDALKYFKQVYHITKFDWHKKAVDLILNGEVEPAREWQEK